MPVCDVCSKAMKFSDGYALTTKEVVLTAAYWTSAFRGGFAGVHQRDSGGGELLLNYIERQASQSHGWLVCEECAKSFSFDRKRAHRLAEQQQDPPDAGPVSPRDAARHAAEAWKRLYGAPPRLGRFSDAIASIDSESGNVSMFRFGGKAKGKGRSDKRKWWERWK